MSSTEIGRQPADSSVKLYDPAAYQIIPGATVNRRQIFNDFVVGFPQYLIRLAESGDEYASDLCSALDKLPNEHLASTISLIANVDFTDESIIDGTALLFSVLKQLNLAVNNPPADYQPMIKEFRDVASSDSLTFDAPLASNTKWLFQNMELGVQHGYLWESYITGELAKRYVIETDGVMPKEVRVLYQFADTIYANAMEQAEKGIDSREVGLGQILGELVRALAQLEKGDSRYDYSVRKRIAETLDPVLQIATTQELEPVLAGLAEYMKPVDIDLDRVQGAIFKPVIITNSQGETLVKEWQRFDSFWFENPFGDESIQSSLESGFPDKPQIILSFFDDDPGEAKDKRVTIYKDPSYFRQDGSKVYWGDLSPSDVAKIKGDYYCLTQRESFHSIPEWATVVANSADNSDPNRPVDSLINRLDGQTMPDNPIWVDPWYMRVVAVGAITNGRFIENHRHCRIEFV